MFYVRKSLAIGLLITCFSGLVFAQGGATGAITGTVQDASQAVVSGAEVDVVNEATGRTERHLTTDSSGVFTATLLPVGTYPVRVSASGFGPTKFHGMVVNITETTRITAALKVSSVNEVMEVQPQVAEVNTTDATTGESLGSTTITDLPLATRNFQQLLTLSAGASSDLNNASQLGRGQFFIHVNGGREDNNNYLIDGISVADYSFGELTYPPLPNPDAIEEFKVSTSLYDGTQGRNGGGNINATLKSGTSKLHGDAWEYFRNTVLDANDYFLNQAHLPRPVIKQNIFGGDLGGPIGPQAKFGYFYGNYQGTRQRSGDSPGTFINTTIPVLPTARDAASLAAAFSSAASPNCPAINLNTIDPVALALLNAKSNQFGGGGGGWLFPTVPGTPGVTQSFNPATGTCSSTVNTGPLIVTKRGRVGEDQVTANWDREFNGGKDRLSERFFWADSDTFQPFGADSFGIQTGGAPTPNNLNFPLDIPLHNRVGSITETHVFNNRVVNEFRFGVNVISDKLDNKPPITNAQAGINLPTANGDPNIYRFQFGSFAFGPFPQQLQRALSDSFVWTDTVGWSRGAHQFRFGGEIDRTTIRRNLPVADNGLVFFAGPTGLPTDFQSFLAGAPFFGEAGGGVGNHDYRIPAAAWFAQDDYRVSKSLTLNLGVRNEFVGAPSDTLCHLSYTDPTLANSTGQQFLYPSCAKKFNLPGLTTATKQRSALNNNYATVWEPRIGFAYDLGGHHTTSIRGGYGIYSVREDLGAVDNLSFSPPFFPIAINFLPGQGSLANLFQSNPATGFPGIPPLGVLSPAFVPQAAKFTGFQPSCTLGNGAPSTNSEQCAAGFTGNVNSLIGLQVPLNCIAATTHQCNLTIQRELARKWFAELDSVAPNVTHF